MRKAETADQAKDAQGRHEDQLEDESDAEASYINASKAETEVD